MLFALLTILPVFAAAVPITAPVGSCAQVGIITARASTESPGEGIIGTLAGLIQSNSKQTVSRASVDYPALLVPYAQSSAAGTAALTKQLTQAVQDCPSQKIVLLGYSQGAHVVGDVLGGGGGGLLGAETPAIDFNSIGSHVAAIVQMGDPRHRSDESYHVGTSTTNGLFPRGTNQLLTKYVSKARTFCDAGDPFCASGFNTAVHLGYTTEYDTNALQFVLNLIGG